MDSQKEYWANKEKEVEETFLELEEQVTCAVQKPVPKQKMEKREEEPQQHFSDPFAKYAAELQVEFFTKVSSHPCILPEYLLSYSPLQRFRKRIKNHSIIIYVNLL